LPIVDKGRDDWATVTTTAERHTDNEYLGKQIISLSQQVRTRRNWLNWVLKAARDTAHTAILAFPDEITVLGVYGCDNQRIIRAVRRRLRSEFSDDAVRLIDVEIVAYSPAFKHD